MSQCVKQLFSYICSGQVVWITEDDCHVRRSAPYVCAAEYMSEWP
jgi:hypothetical protein